MLQGARSHRMDVSLCLHVSYTTGWVDVFAVPVPFESHFLHFKVLSGLPPRCKSVRLPCIKSSVGQGHSYFTTYTPNTTIIFLVLVLYYLWITFLLYLIYKKIRLKNDSEPRRQKTFSPSTILFVERLSHRGSRIGPDRTLDKRKQTKENRHSNVDTGVPLDVPSFGLQD